MAQILGFKNDYTGLTTDAAEEQLKLYGLNTCAAEGKPFSVPKLILTPRTFLMAAAAGIMFFLGQILSGCVMTLLLAAYITIKILTEVRIYRRELETRRLSGMKYRVVRNGELTLVRKEYLVPDDILILQKGERVPADAHLLETSKLTVDESLFTGDKTPVEKEPGSDSSRKLPKKSCVYKNTIILSGSLVARIFATGEDATHYEQTQPQPGHFASAVKRVALLFNIAALILILPAALFTFSALPENEKLLTSIPLALLTGIGFGMCFIPAEASQLIRLYYITCADRLHHRHALVKNLHVIENLSALTCICVEKSGTITKNHLEVSGEYTENRPMFLNVSVLACEPSPDSPIEKAILLNATFAGVDARELQDNKLIAQYPFSDNTKTAGNLWEINGSRLLCIKGSPETVLTLCDIDTDQLHFIQNKCHTFTAAGEQVLAVAYRMLSPKEKEPAGLLEARYTYIGLIAFSSQTRDTVPYAVKCCYKAGVNVIMTTGDNEETAAAIGRKIGLKEGRAITGEELRQCRINGVKPDLSGVNIFARVTPAQRCEIVRILQEQGEIVAITGSGIEDLEILEQADVGVAAGGNACPAAVESSGLQLGDDNFMAIVDAIKECRQVHLNIKRFISLLLSAETALAIFALVNLLTGGTLIVTPLLACLFSTIIIPACSLMFLDNQADMKSDFIPSGFMGKGRINRKFLLGSLIQGGTLGAGLTMFYFMSLGLEAPVLRSAMFIMYNLGVLICGLTGMSGKHTIYSTAKEKRGMFSLFISGAVTLISLMLVYIPYLNSAFGMSTLSVLVLLVGLLITVLFNGWPELIKMIKEKNKG